MGKTFELFHLMVAALGLGRVVGDLPGLQPCPFIPLDPDAHGEENRGDDDDLHAHALPVVHLGLGGPVEELGDVLGHLRGGGRGLVLVLDQAVVEDAGHGDAGAGEVGVEVEAGADLGADRRLLGVAGQEGEDVVAAAVPGLDDQAEVGGEGTVVGEAGGLVILVGGGHVIGQLSGPLLDLALVVGVGVVLILLGQCLGFVDGQDRTHERAVGNSVEGMACCADLPVDLETTAKSVVLRKKKN